jgi:hypothetical protein
MIGLLMNWKRYERKRSWPNLRYCPGIYVVELRKIIKNLKPQWSVSGSRFEPGTSRIQSRIANHSDVMFGDTVS